MSAPLTARERRVKSILMQELKRMSALSYAEKQHLEKRIDIAFIDRELVKMERYRKWETAFPLVFGSLFGILWISNGVRGSDPFLVGMGLFMILSGGFGAYRAYTSARRKLFIYQALRELVDADEADLVLDRVMERTDLLIERVVACELETEHRYPMELLRRVGRN